MLAKLFDTLLSSVMRGTFFLSNELREHTAQDALAAIMARVRKMHDSYIQNTNQSFMPVFTVEIVGELIRLLMWTPKILLVEGILIGYIDLRPFRDPKNYLYSLELDLGFIQTAVYKTSSFKELKLILDEIAIYLSKELQTTIATHLYAHECLAIVNQNSYSFELSIRPEGDLPDLIITYYKNSDEFRKFSMCFIK